VCLRYPKFIYELAALALHYLVLLKGGSSVKFIFFFWGGESAKHEFFSVPLEVIPLIAASGRV